MQASSDEMQTVLYGRPITIRSERRPVDGLRLNPNNPRLRHELFLENKVLSEPEIESHLWEQQRTKDLYSSVLATGGIQNELWIRNDGTTEEGNRRVVVCRKIKANLLAGKYSGRDATVAQTIIENIPVRVLPDTVTDKEIDVLLAREHIAGKYPWEAVDQAEHLYIMNNDDGMSVDEIAQVAERSRPWVYQKLKAFGWTKDYLINNPRGNKNDFSKFEEIHKVRSSLRKRANFDADDRQDMQYFHSLINNNKIKAAIEVRDLPEILADPEAKRILESDGYDKAWIYTQTKNPGISSPTFQTISDATKAIQTIPLNEYQDIPANPQKKKLVLELYHELDKLKKNLSI